MLSLLTRRGLAYFTDFSLVMMLYMAYRKLLVPAMIPHNGAHPPINHNLVVLFMFYCYYILTEYFFQRSLAKMLFQLKVVKTDGSALTFADVVKRHLFDIVELLVF